MSETRTYRGATLEEVLPRIREELGPEAVITRQREGVVGGIGGFFGKRCVEVEARTPEEAQPFAAVPVRHAFDAYDVGAPTVVQDDGRNPVIETLIGQASPFADHLRAAEAAAERDEDEAAFAALPPEPVAEITPAPGAAAAPVRPSHRDEAATRAHLAALGLPEPVITALVRDVEQHLLPFEPAVPYSEHARRALAGQIQVRHGWRTKRRTIALVGAAGSGKTLTAAKLCHAYANASALSVGTLSLESTADAYRLGTLTDDLDIDIRVADTPDGVSRALARMRDEQLIVVDTPPVSPGDPDSIARLERLLAAAQPDEVHLTVPAATDVRAVRALLDALSGRVNVGRLLITRLDEMPSAAVAVGVSLTVRKPFSYVASGRDPRRGLRPADPAELAALVMM